MESCSVWVNPKLSRLERTMNPNKGRVLISLALMVSGMVGVAVALSQSPRSATLFQNPPAKTEPVAVTKTIQQTPPKSRAQEIATQFDQSLAGQLLKGLSNQADEKVQDSKTAVGNFIKQKTDEQRENLKQIVIETLQETVSGEVNKQTQLLKTEFNGVQLTPDQLAQIQQARREMQAEIMRELQANPELIKQIQSGKVDQNISQPLKDYRDVVASVLTPQQREQWQKNFSLLNR